MKANWKRTLLSLVLCAGFVWPAGAVSTGQPAAPQTGTSTAQSKPAAYTVKKMGLLGVKRTVESDNNTVKMLNKTAASLDSSSYASSRLDRLGRSERKSDLHRSYHQHGRCDEENQQDTAA